MRLPWMPVLAMMSLGALLLCASGPAAYTIVDGVVRVRRGRLESFELAGIRVGDVREVRAEHDPVADLGQPGRPVGR